jgi:uncharacterized membrane protein
VKRLEFLKRHWAGLVLLAFAAAHVYLFTKLFVSGSFDVELYFSYASRIASGLLPYRDFQVEYPPGALLVFLIPRWFASEVEPYGTAFAIEMLIFNLACLVMVFLLARRLRLSPVGTVAIYSLAVVSVSSIAVQRFDFASAALSLAAVYALSRGRFNYAWALLALGTLVKLYPIALTPLFFIYQWRHQRWQKLIGPVAVFGIIMLAGVLPFWRLSPEGFMHAFNLQSGRNLQIESSYASVLFMLFALGRTSLSVFQGPVSWDLESPYSADIANISLVVMFFAAAAVYVSYLIPYRAPRVNEGPPEPPAVGRLVNYSLLLIVMLLLTSKVVSTQFMVWLVPLIPLVTGRARHAAWIAFVGVGFFSWYTYPIHYWDLRRLNLTPMQVIAFRNVLMALLAFWLWELKEPGVDTGVTENCELTTSN